MNIFEQMQKPPFNLDEGQIGWVKETFSKMDLKAKVGQLFCLAARSSEEQWVNDIFDICEPCGFMYRPMPLDATLHFTELLDKKATIPMLIAADVEKGGNGLVSDVGTLIGSPMAIAATMVGFNAAMPRRKSVPYSIASGADMFLFPKNLKEDFDFMMDGIRDGIVTEERIDEAVLRILGLKAALRLYEKKLPVLEEAVDSSQFNRQGK